MKKFLLLFGFTIFMATVASANDVYVAQSSAGANDGTSCANAHAVSFFNSSGNWGTGAGQIGPDTTVHLCGTLSGSLGSTLLTAQGSGTSGHPIIILWEPGAVLTAPAWNTSVGAINLSNQSWITLDGGGPDGTNGIVQCTANGTAFANQTDSVMVKIDSTSHITIQNLWFKDNYVRIANTSGSTGFNAQDILGTNASDVLVTHNKFTNGRNALGVAFDTTGQNFEFSHNYTFAIEVPCVLATATANAVYTSALVHDNHFAGGVDQWDDPGNGFHHDGGFHFFAQASGAHINGFKFYNNLTDGIWGNDAGYFSSTGGTHITAYAYPEETGGSVDMFNNIFNLTAGDPRYTTGDNGTIFCKSKNSSGMVCHFYNNVIIGPSGNTTYGIGYETDGSTHDIAKNNIFMNLGLSFYLGGAGNSAITADGNVFYQLGANAWNQGSFSGWQSSGQDANGQNGKNPMLDSNFKPQSGSSAIQHADNLWSMGIPQLDIDKAGLQRPSSGNWDVGAYQSGGTTTTAPNPPTGLAASVN